MQDNWFVADGMPTTGFLMISALLLMPLFRWKFEWRVLAVVLFLLSYVNLIVLNNPHIMLMTKSVVFVATVAFLFGLVMFGFGHMCERDYFWTRKRWWKEWLTSFCNEKGL